MHRLGVLGATGLGALAVVVGASAALEVRLSIVPAAPHVGEPVRVELRSFVPVLRRDGSCCRLEPHAPRRYPFRLEAVSPRGTVTRLRVTRAAGNRWTARARFREPGVWQLRVANWGPRYARSFGARPQIRVRVLPRAAG